MHAGLTPLPRERGSVACLGQGFAAKVGTNSPASGPIWDESKCDEPSQPSRARRPNTNHACCSYSHEAAQTRREVLATSWLHLTLIWL
jgi:hypothetical protein